MSYYANTTQPTSATYPYGGYQAHYPFQAGYSPWQQAYYAQYMQSTGPRVAQSATAPTQTRPVAQIPTAPTAQRQAAFQSYTPTASTSYARESVAAASSGGATGRGGRRQANMKGLFTKELKNIMYGFGDDRNPSSDTVNVMEEILIEYITDVCLAAGGPTRKGRLAVEDLRKVLSRPADAKKLARMEELIFMQEDIKRARAQFEESDNPRGF